MQHKLSLVLIIGIITIITYAGTAAAFWGSKDKKEQQEQTIAKATDNKKTSDTPDETKLVQLDSLEDSFLKSVRRRKTLAVSVLNLQAKLEKTEDEKEKKALSEQIDKAQKELEILNLAMDVVFSPIQPRQYEYNPVRSTVYVKVGNIEQVFIRSFQVRDGLLQAIREEQQKLAEEKNDEGKKKIQDAIDNIQRQYQTVVASLQIVFDVIPQRNYLYNPKDSTLYLKVTEEEAKKVQEQIDKMSEKDSKPSEAAHKK